MSNKKEIEQDIQNESYDDYCETIYLNDEQVMPKGKKSSGSVTSLVLGIIGSVAWIVPIVAIPINVVGIVLGSINMKNSKHKGIAISGFVINIVFLLVAIAKGIVDIVKCSRNK